MRYNRTKNATRNIAFSFCQRIYSLIIPFLIRTVFLYTLGTQYLGLDSLFGSILQVLNLTELGVGTAMVYSMYKPLVEDDTETVCALMRLYKRYYRMIGLAVLVLGLAVMPFLPFLIKEELPADIDLYVLYLFHLASTVATYWLFAYKNCIIAANQRVDINVKINMAVTTLAYMAQIAVLLFVRSYYWYIAVKIFTSVLSNLVTAAVADRIFPQFKARGELSSEAVHAVNCRVRDLFTARIGRVVVYSVDTIVISAFLGLTVLAKYQNYLFIMKAVTGCIGVVYSSMQTIIGNSIVTESPTKNYKIFRIFLFVIAWISAVCSAFFLCLYQPFMELWLGKELMLDFGVVICFCIYFFMIELNRVFNLYKDASGMWHSDRLRPFVISVVNLTLNLLTVQLFGLYGIILSTVIPIVFLGIPWLSVSLCHEIFEVKYIKSILGKVALYFVSAVLSSALTYFVCARISLSLIPTIVLRGAVCVILPNVILFLMLCKTRDFKDAVTFADKKLFRGKFRILQALTR